MIVDMDGFTTLSYLLLADDLYIHGPYLNLSAYASIVWAQ